MSKSFQEFETSSDADPADDFLGAIDPAFAEFLEMVAAELHDQLDHPEIWPILRDLALQDDGPGMLAQMARVRPYQNSSMQKVLDIAIGIMTAASVDQVDGLALLKQLEYTHSLCPQVAGASFFVTNLDTPERADLSNRFCSYPFDRFDTLIDGTVAPCCSIWTRKRLGRLDDQSFDEIWNGADAQDMRESILDGSFRHCNKQRCTYIANNTLPLRDEVADPAMRAVIDEGRTQLDAPPRNLALAHDATCNLACPSCRSELLTATEEQEARFDKILHNVFHPLLQGGKDISLFLSGQGDPFSSQHYRSILRYVADNELPIEKLIINTNALLMGPKRWSEYQGLEKYKPGVRVSIDACTPWVYEEVRRPGKFERLYENLSFISELYRAGTFSVFNVNATIQLDNYHEIPALIDFAEHVHSAEILFYMIQNTGSHLHGSYDRMNIGDSSHPLHPAFLETLRDPKLDRPIVNMYDVAIMRDLAMGSHLPSDDLNGDFGYENIISAIRAALAAEDHSRAVALCVAGRIRFPGDQALLRTEASALTAMGFAKQAGYRLRMAEALEEIAPRKIDRLVF